MAGRTVHRGATRVIRPHFAPGEREYQKVRFRVPPSQGRPKRVFLNCHYCGYEPEGQMPPNGVCPKCRGSSWERFAVAEPLLPEHMR